MMDGVKEKILDNESGQTIVEYILILSVMITIIGSCLSIVKSRMGDITKCETAPNNTRIMCKINEIFVGKGNKKFQYYRFK